MPKILTGKIISVKMQNTVLVRVTATRPHPIYKKKIKKDRNLKADKGGLDVKIGDMVKLAKTRPISKDKHFKVVEIVKK